MWRHLTLNHVYIEHCHHSVIKRQITSHDVIWRYIMWRNITLRWLIDWRHVTSFDVETSKCHHDVIMRHMTSRHHMESWRHVILYDVKTCNNYDIIWRQWRNVMQRHTLRHVPKRRITSCDVIWRWHVKVSSWRHITSYDVTTSYDVMTSFHVLWR